MRNKVHLAELEREREELVSKMSGVGPAAAEEQGKIGRLDTGAVESAMLAKAKKRSQRKPHSERGAKAESAPDKPKSEPDSNRPRNRRAKRGFGQRKRKATPAPADTTGNTTEKAPGSETAPGAAL